MKSSLAYLLQLCHLSGGATKLGQQQLWDWARTRRQQQSLWREGGVAVQNVAKAGQTWGTEGFCTVLEGCAALSDAQNCY